jgi:MIP family channel proteins
MSNSTRLTHTGVAQHDFDEHDYSEHDIGEEEEEEEIDVEPEIEYEIETVRSLLRPAGAELIGSALFVFIACGAGMTTVHYSFVGSTTIGIALTFGLTIAVLAYTIGHISGGHLNFAVTFTLALLRRISIMRAAFYFLAQFIGGLIGIGFLKLITPKMWWTSCFANNAVHAELTVGHAFVTEFILTFYLMFVVMAACDSNKSNQTLVPLAIGFAVFSAHMLGLPITGCSINPTRTFASAAAASGVEGCNAWADHWVFWFAPLMGASLAGVLYEYCFHEGGGKVDRLIDQYVLKKTA